MPGTGEWRGSGRPPTGLDESAIEALRSATDPGVVEPSDDDLRAQLTAEREASHAHLRRIVDGYWERRLAA